MSELIKEMPSLHDMLNDSDINLSELVLFDPTSEGYKEEEKAFYEELKKEKPNRIKMETHALSMQVEAQKAGFEQGFAFAIKLLMK